ncbi:MAG: LTA synthase family protein [Bergeyella sp.]|nr:LTA synthase family protein [Bergeyella sp.]
MKLYLQDLRKKELTVLFYRVFLVFVFYQIARFLFWFYNRDLLKIENVYDYLGYAYHGIAFDTTAILYTNALFILASILPLKVNTKRTYQKILYWIYFVSNGIGFGINFIDFFYFRFSQTRLTSAIWDVVKNERNIFRIFLCAVGEKPGIPILFILSLVLWNFFYGKVRVKPEKTNNDIVYFVLSIVYLCLITTLVVGGIRGDFKHSTRPINMIDAGKFTKNPQYANVVLNSAFSLIRTIGNDHFRQVDFVDKNYIKKNIYPYKIYNRVTKQKPNIVIFIVESLGREYIGAFNREKKIGGYVSYTPFLDSLSQKSLIFPNTFANGRQSIHAMSSILAGIPSLKDAFTSSPYANQKIQSLVSVCNELGYDTSFYHGAPNGSMGFLGFSRILGFDHYFGKNEYNDDKDFDGIWAIWDEPFLQYFSKNIGKRQPFMATVFTASSHHPFKIPENYKGKFKKGKIEIHEPIQYTDHAIRKFFDSAKKTSWYQNTIFVITGDHTNQIYYDEYKKSFNKFSVPLILFSPDKNWNLRGIDRSFAQQIDIYPTLSDLIGYNKPIRSWGRSVLSDKKYPSIIVSSDGTAEQFVIGEYLYRFDGREVVGVYEKEDLDFQNNLIEKLNSPEIEKSKKDVKAWYQDYMDRIMNRKLK